MSDLKFSEYILNGENLRASTVFKPAGILPLKIPVTTPFTFPIENESVYLCLDKSGWWNPLGGHIEQDESWEDAIKREALEEAGVEVDKIILKGYVFVKHLVNNSKYPPESVLPITISTVNKYHSIWNKLETKDRGKFTFIEALEKFRLRGDNNQMFEIFNYIIKTKYE